MRIGELLIGAKLATLDQVETALQRQSREGGYLGAILVDMGVLATATLERLLRISPLEPTSLAELKIKDTDLLDLLL